MCGVGNACVAEPGTQGGFSLFPRLPGSLDTRASMPYSALTEGHRFPGTREEGHSLPEDLSWLDRPEALQMIFPVVYSPFLPDDVSFLPPPEPVYSIEVEGGARIDCGFWVAGRQFPTILYFHGNGETVGTCDWIAPSYTGRRINLFVADYRGYGSSTGKPTISNMIDDAHTIFRGFKEVIERRGFSDSVFVMGRSLGSIPAVEVAFGHQDDIRGLIIESGMANNFRPLWEGSGRTAEGDLSSERSLFFNKVKIRRVRKPTLVIHGEHDQLIPLGEGDELYQNSGANDKRMLVVPGAGHNDLMMVNPGLYFDTIDGFVRTYG